MESYYSRHREVILAKAKEKYANDADFRKRQREYMREYWREYRENNKEKILEVQSKYRAENRDKILESKRKSREKHREHYLEYQRIYRQEHKEELTRHKREWRREHYAIEAARNSIRRGDKVADNAITNNQWETTLQYFGNSCAYCGAKAKLEMDHFYPLFYGGKLEYKNVIPACKSCNTSKRERPFTEWYRDKDFYNPEREQKILAFIGGNA